MRVNCIRTLVVFVALATAIFAGAQGFTTGGIEVTVLDPSGAVIPGAVVTIESPGRPAVQANSDSRGVAIFTALDVTTYTVRAEMAGFNITEAKGVQVRLGERTSVRLSMEVGAVAQTIEVVGAAAGIDHSTTTIGENIPESLYQNVPMDRNVVNPIYASPGVTEGGGTGFLNPAIAGASGLENLTLIDGVNANNTAFGGFGIFTRVFGSIGTGVTTSFIQEIKVTTGGMEAQYGQVGGGVVQMITKSGSNDFHGAIYGYYQPDATQDEYEDPNARRTNPGTYHRNDELIDYGFELGGRIVQDKVFFFGSLNPTLRFDNVRAPFLTAGDPQPEFVYGPLGIANLGTYGRRRKTINYAGKLTFQLHPSHRVDASIFGDDNKQAFGPNRTVGLLEFNSPTQDAWSAWDFSALNWTVRYEGSMTPTWLVSASVGQNHARFFETDFAPKFWVQDRTHYNPITNIIDSSLPSNINRQGIGFFENTTGGADQSWDIASTHIFDTAGLSHQLTAGFQYEDSSHEGIGTYSGPDYVTPNVPGIDPAIVGELTQGGIWRIFTCPDFFGDADCAGFVPASAQIALSQPYQGFTDIGFFALSIRGGVRGQEFVTASKYASLYAQDDIAINKYLTFKLGLRWEQLELSGVDTKAGFTRCTTGFSQPFAVPIFTDKDQCAYTFTGAWSPRIGVVVDPWGDRRAKAYFSFGRFHERVPLDMAQRSLVGEVQNLLLEMYPEIVTNPTTGGLEFEVIPDVAHNVPIGFCCFNFGLQPGAIHPGTRLQYLDEFVVGFEYEFRHGIVLSGRYQDRRLKRMLEDLQAPTIAEALAGFEGQYIIANAGSSTDIFDAFETIAYVDPVADCYPGTDDGPGAGLCFTPNSGVWSGGDGQPDGFANPIRNYQAVEISVERRFQDNWQLLANWRISKLNGNFEGSFRNDNGQTDPNITSLWDFTSSGAGDPLEGQFAPGPLPNDRKHVVNVFASYLFNEGVLNGLNVGAGWRIQTGRPLTPLRGHPVYLNAGELPDLSLGGRGGLGRTETTYPLDVHVDYTFKLTERFRLKALFDVFNLGNQERVLKVNDHLDLGISGGVPTPNPDFLLPGGSAAASSKEIYQRPFTTRFALRLEF